MRTNLLNSLLITSFISSSCLAGRDGALDEPGNTRKSLTVNISEEKENIKPVGKKGVPPHNKKSSLKLNDDSSALIRVNRGFSAFQNDLMEVESTSLLLSQQIEKFSQKIMAIYQALYDQPKIESKEALISLRDELMELSFAEDTWKEYAITRGITKWPRQESWKEAVLSDFFCLKYFNNKYPRDLTEVIDYGNYFEGKDFYKRPDVIWSLAISAGFKNPASLYYLGHFLEPLVTPCEHGAYKDKLPKKMWKQSMAEFSALLDDSSADPNLRKEARYMWALEGGYLCHLEGDDVEGKVITLLSQSDRSLREELLWLQIRSLYAPNYLKRMGTTPSTKEEYEALLLKASNNYQVFSLLAEFGLKEQTVENLKQIEPRLLSWIDQGWTEGNLYLGDAYFTLARKWPPLSNTAELEQKGKDYLTRAGKAGIAQGYMGLGYWLSTDPSLSRGQVIKSGEHKKVIQDAYDNYKEAGEWNHPGGWKLASSMAGKLWGYTNDKNQLCEFQKMKEQMWDNYQLSVYLSFTSLFPEIQQHLKEILK